MIEHKLDKSFYLKIRPWLLRILAVLLIIMSASTVLSEITMFINLPLNVFGLLIDQTKNIFLMNILVLAPLIFLFLTSLYGLFQLKLSGLYAIHGNRHTYSFSLLFLAGFMCRIGFPLCLNFINFLKISTDKKQTILEELLGVIDLIPVLGKNFSMFYPTILIILCLFNIFDLYGKFMNFLGFPSFGFDNQHNNDKMEEGVEQLEKSNLFIVLILINFLTILF
jgi:hypothetical protein